MFLRRRARRTRICGGAAPHRSNSPVWTRAGSPPASMRSAGSRAGRMTSCVHPHGKTVRILVRSTRSTSASVNGPRHPAPAARAIQTCRRQPNRRGLLVSSAANLCRYGSRRHRSGATWRTLGRLSTLSRRTRRQKIGCGVCFDRATHVDLRFSQFNFDAPTGLGCGCSSIFSDASSALRKCKAAVALQRSLAQETNLTSTESS
jgi:hypothetical protein